MPTRTDRERQILRALSPTTPLSVHALTRLTGVSGVTIRRDLAALAADGLVTRVHGGALRAPLRGSPQPISLRRGEDLEAKRVLARATADMIEEGQSLIIDNGTTCELVAHELVGRRIRVLCLSVAAAAVLASSPGPVVTVPGGVVQTDTLAMLTSTAVDAVRRFRADVGVLGACAASPSGGLTCVEDDDAALKAAIIASSARCLMPATARKLTRSSTYRFGGLSDLDTLLTTSDVDGDVVAQLRQAGLAVELHEA
ncbi:MULTISPECIES: DeoR/GlpR family DNA-binding transcription regulator [unclassified Actinomyces]|uniref:DeoR/GlpR family DNA-binding transcription regulator n=1 Tax=unclassified Actinomyces TaxID=2609248 RepID=UPI0020178138|nr:MULTISPECIES: DeoR/GlpR family DNA-binding transcription regulator [unclassified Actinomyces]MCL3778053.1 DeoR/GlpR transcriptional regulator [Actinomyces sp. AC-20-1]MCL3789861.1 DeoR/GlpR transcriptional regulator [Actinomyces sp. 187325]MCL3792016.1 DeoR/GlpR transcriptional regulator [Actinomyces sp. 186855]MCL3794718.1 DeoR/GlpR transcriptional regulator [Actinomyces sp. 217892]